MSDQHQESEFLRELHVMQDTDASGVYAAAKAELKKQLPKFPGHTKFSVCDGASTETRRYVVDCFKRDGLDAELADYERCAGWDCETRQVSCVQVTIPARRQGV